MDFKNKISFFLLSFFLSFSLFIAGQKYLGNLISNDLIAYGLAILFIVIVPLILYLVWAKINKQLLFVLYFIVFLSVIKSIFIIDLNPLIYFLILNKFSLMAIFIFSLITNIFLKINFKTQPFDQIKKILWGSINTPFIKFLAYLLVFLLISFLIYNPKYKYSFERLSLFGYESYHQFHHVTFFVIPIHEILAGKTLLINVSSLYGVVLTYFNSLVFKIVGLSYSNFVLYNMIVSIFYVFFFFLTLKKVSKSFWLALIGTAAYIRLAIFRDLLPSQEIFILPSTTSIRYFLDLIVFYSIFTYFSQPANLKRLFTMTTVVVLAFFYSFDFGLLILVAYIITLLFDNFLSIVNQEKRQKIVSKSSRYFLTLPIVFVSFGLLITLFTFLKSGALPNWGQYLVHLSTQIVQLQDRSLASVIGWYYLPLSIYLVAFYFIFHQAIIKKEKGNQWLVFLLAYGLLLFTYYINLSEPNHLFSILHPAIIILILLFKAAKNKLIQVVFFTGLFWIIFISPEKFTNLITTKINYRYSPSNTNYYYWNYPGTDFYLQDDDGKNFELAAEKIKQLSKKDKEVVIISRYSALLYLMSGKTSLINHPNIEYDIYSIQEFSEALNEIKARRPQFIFVHSPAYSQWYVDIMNTLWDMIKKDYTFKENAGAIDVYQLKNN